MIGRRKKLTIAIALVGIAVYFLAVFPTRSYLLQRQQVKATVAKVKAMQSSNQALQKQVNAMNSPSEIASIARSDYGLVKSGEKAFVVLPPSKSTTTTTQARTSKK